MAVIDGLVAAYSATGGAWQHGPGRVYDRLAEAVIARSPVPIAGAHVLDVGAGTGAVTRAALAGGAARVTAVDAAVGMLAYDAPRRPPAAVADLRAAPFADGSFDVAVAAFSLNHVTDPAAGLREMARVTRSGGALVASAYAAEDAHPAKAAVEAALAARGWRPDPWQAALRSEAVPRLATAAGVGAALREAGLAGEVEQLSVEFPHLDAGDLVAWRLGMAQHADFVSGLPADEVRAVAADAVGRLGPDGTMLVRTVVVVRAIRP
jgi:SAM-dependent methyltransferase